MAVIQEVREKAPPGQVNWAIPHEDIASARIPRPHVVDRRSVVADIGNGLSVAVGIYAMPREPSRRTTLFKRGRTQKMDEVQPARQIIRPPFHLDSEIPTKHADKGPEHPYVILDHRRQYVIGAWVHKDLIGQWSVPQEREAEGGIFSKLSFEREIYRRRKSVALLVRVDGETPLAERERPGNPPERYEMFYGVPEPTEATRTHVFVAFKNRVVDNNGMGGGHSGTATREAQVQGLEFYHLKGKARRDAHEDKGLVDVVVASIIEDEVIEKIYKPVEIPQFRDDMYQPVRSFGYKGLSAGETRFTRERKEQVSITTVKDPEPLARLQVKLVARRRPFKHKMTDAFAQKKRAGKKAGYKSGE